MAPFDFINNQNTIGRVTSSYFYTLNIKIHIKDSTGNYIIFTFILQSTLVISNTCYLELSLSRTFWPVP